MTAQILGFFELEELLGDQIRNNGPRSATYEIPSHIRELISSACNGGTVTKGWEYRDPVWYRMGDSSLYNETPTRGAWHQDVNTPGWWVVMWSNVYPTLVAPLDPEKDGRFLLGKEDHPDSFFLPPKALCCLKESEWMHQGYIKVPDDVDRHFLRTRCENEDISGPYRDLLRREREQYEAQLRLNRQYYEVVSSASLPRFVDVKP